MDIKENNKWEVRKRLITEDSLDRGHNPLKARPLTLYLQITLDNFSRQLKKILLEWSCTNVQHIFKGTTWKRPEIQNIKGPSPQRPRAHHDLVSAVSIVECLLCDSEHTGFAESVCDHLSQFDVARARRVSSRSLLSLTAIV